MSRFLLLLALACLLAASVLTQPAYAQEEESSTAAGEESSTGGEEFENTTSSSTGAEEVVVPVVYGLDGNVIDAEYIENEYYTCGRQHVNASRGVYLNGTEWESNNMTYRDGYLNIDSSGSFSTYRGYPQCWGSSATDSCFDAWQDNVNYTEFKTMELCNTTMDGQTFVKGDVSPGICLVFGGGHRLFKMTFYPKVDQFALLEVQGSFNGTSNNNYDAWMHWATGFQVELGGMVSSGYRHRYGMSQTSSCVDSTTGGTCTTELSTMCTVVPFHTIVIKLSHGTLESITFDDDCSLCDTDYCVDGNCAQDIDTCEGAANAVSGASTDCNFKLYVSWSGTDSEGVYLSSSQRRLSQFRRWSLRSVYNQASSLSLSDLPVASTSGYDD